VQPARAAQIGVRLVSLEELLGESDFISIHLPKTPETLGLIGEKNCAWSSRAYASSTPPAVASSTSRRWPTRSPRAGRRRRHRRLRQGAVHRVALFAHDGVVVTPHLGASTVEAQDKAVSRSPRA